MKSFLSAATLDKIKIFGCDSNEWKSGTFRVSSTVSTGKAAKSSKEAERRQTIAERKASGEVISSTKKEEGN